LGFAELPPVTPPAAPAPPAGPGSLTPMSPAAGGPAPVPSKAGDAVDRKQWRTNFAAFASNISVAADPTGKPSVDWGELRELREIICPNRSNFASLSMIRKTCENGPASGRAPWSTLPPDCRSPSRTK
jgi:hypothetical protein